MSRTTGTSIGLCHHEPSPHRVGIALRYGNLYGPGTNVAQDGDVSALVRARKVPIIGSGAGVWSFLHVRDAASATIAAIDRGAEGVYNICDDEPAPVAEWLPELARAWREATNPCADVDRTIGRGRGWRLDDDADSRCIEREGEAGIILAAALQELAAGLLDRTFTGHLSLFGVHP